MIASLFSAAAKRNARSSVETKGMSTASIRFNSAGECTSAAWIPARGPHPEKMSATTDPYFEDPYFVDPYFVNFAGSPTILTLSQTSLITPSARSSSDWPPNSRKALSTPVPMRELLPPAMMKPMRDGSVRAIWKSIRPTPRYTKVTYSERPVRRKMDMPDWYGGTTRHHAAKTDGCSHAGTLFARVFLAAPRG